jgi:1-acyl-sn-glycerol-3-phosphate acyltransferase
VIFYLSSVRAVKNIEKYLRFCAVIVRCRRWRAFDKHCTIALQVGANHPLIGAPSGKGCSDLLLRALIYKGLFFSLTALWVVLLGFTLLWPNYRAAQRGVAFWGTANLFLLRYIVGIRVEIRGLEKLPAVGPYIICPKHESTIDAFLALHYIPDTTALGKSELFEIPILGLVLRKMELIAVDRHRGEAHKDLPDVHDVIKLSRRPILIFPEGTRVPQGETRPLKPGAFHLQDGSDLRVFTCATNTGYFWGAKGLLMRPGLVIWEIHDAMPKGLKKEGFHDELFGRVVTRSEELKDEARGNDAQAHS